MSAQQAVNAVWHNKTVFQESEVTTMIVRRVKYIDGDGSQVFEIGESGYDIRYFKVTTIWLFGIIPIYYSKAQVSVIAPRT